MSLFDDRGLRLPSAVALRPISNGSRFLYMLLLDDYGKVGMFGTFCPGDYKNVMRVSNRQVYRYFYELVTYDCIYEEKGFFRFRYE